MAVTGRHAHETQHAHDTEARQPRLVETAGPRRDVWYGPSARASRYELAAQLAVSWCAVYTAVRWWTTPLEAAAQASLASIIWVLVFRRVTQALRPMSFVAGPFVAAVLTSLIGVAAWAVLGYWWQEAALERSALALLGATTFVGLGGWGTFVRRAARAPQRVVVVGGGEATRRLLEQIDERSAGLDVIAVVDDSVEPGLAARVPLTAPLSKLAGTVRELSPDLVVIAVQRGRPEVFAQLLEVAETGFRIAGLPEIYEFTFGRLPVDELTPAWFMSVLHAYNRPANRVGKRIFDILVASVAIVVALPIVPVLVVIVKRTKGPLLYKQTRLGEHGREFTMLKFRSMHANAEDAGEARWAAKNDDRVIHGGRTMRLLRLDELPQLWNVLRGQMSIVGPRPERPEFLGYLGREVPFWNQRHLLKPGITGWAQIRSEYAADALATRDKLAYDLWYLRHRSVFLDSLICLQTIPRMVTFGGAR